MSNLEILAGVGGEGCLRDVSSADVFLHTDFGYLGAAAVPLVPIVADLSFVRAPKNSSLAWHGRRIARKSLDMAVRNAKRVVAISNFTRVDLLEYAAELEGRVDVVHNGIDPKWFATPPHFGSMGHDRPYWIWWGQITKRKNITGLLRGYSLARSRFNGDVPELLLVGSVGRESNKVPRLINELGLGQHVTMLPFQPLERLMRLVRDSQGLVFPSFYEGFGLPVIEAMAQGRPVLTSSVSALPEVAGGHAVLCDPHSDDSIAAGLRALREPEVTSEAATRNRREWAGNFTYERAAAGYSEVIDSVAG